MNSRIWQTDRFTPVVSSLTGRTILINDDPDRFLIPPSFSVAALRQALASFDYFVATCSERCHPSVTLSETLKLMRTAASVDAFGDGLVSLLAARFVSGKTSSDPSRIRDLLVRLWRADCLVWPLVQTQGGEMQLSRMRLSLAWGWGDDVQQLMAAFRSAREQSRTDDARLKAFLTLLVCRGGVRVAGDLTPDVVGDFFASQMKISTLRHSTAGILLTLQQAAHGDSVRHSVADFGHFGRPSVRSDDQFAWVITADPSLTEWRTAAADFMSKHARGVASRRTGMNAFFDYLIANPTLPRSPADYLRTNRVLTPAFASNNSKNLSAVYEFLDYILDTRCIDEDDFGNKVRLPGFRNPLVPVRRAVRDAETHRHPMPTRFVRMLYDILTENDFAWPKAAGKTRGNKKGRGDWFMAADPQTGEVTPIWSPVRTIAILIKLLLPPRTFQVRVLDSGEADTEVYRPGQGWVRNTGPLAPASKRKVAQGVFYRYRDPKDDTERVFLRFNTNKTADLAKNDGEAGFTMPWEHKEAIGLLSWLRDWQERHNLLSCPAKWSDLVEVDITSRYTKEALIRRGEACFLFRDPVSQYNDQPVTDARLTWFWRKLCAELERRLAAAGETMPDGSPITLVHRRDNGDFGPALFDLHSLRVTIITALSESGGVPADILMKVVGHSSIIMTFYYQKISPVHISERLFAADLRRQADEQANWQRWLVGKERETLLKSVAFTMPSAVDAVAEVSPTAWIERDHGICPVGCARCHEGGEKLVDITSYERWGAVPGGPSNCVRCRFFITGPVFLSGLQAHFDAVGFRLREASARYQAAKTKFEALEADYKMARERGEAVPQARVHELEVASGLLDQQTKMVDELALTWSAAYRLIQQCLAILRRGSIAQGNSYALIAVGGTDTLEAVLEETTEFELADRVCQTAVFYEGIDATVPNLKRMRAFDAMLRRNGYNPVFVEMTEADALAVGNQMAAFLYTRRGRENTNALLEGRETLRRLGIEADFMRALDAISPIPIGTRNAHSLLLDQQPSTRNGKNA